MESRNRICVRRLLKKILASEYSTTWSLKLKGATSERTAAVRKANKYLSLLSLTPSTQKAIPPSLNRTIAECRKVAGSNRLGCAARIEACEILLYIEGLPIVPRFDDPNWGFVLRELGASPSPEEKEVPTRFSQKFFRKQNRGGALKDIRQTLREDIDAGRVKNLSEAAEYLRLPEMPAREVEHNLGEVHREELKQFLESLKGGENV